MMREIIYSLPNQISAAVGFVPRFGFKKGKYDEVLICGMGGSGVSGELLAVLYPRIRIISNKDYLIPGFIGKNTLAILVSYSGNTEETLSSYHQLLKQKIDVVILSSDGKLFEMNALHKIKVPQGLPPRGALGYLFTPLPILLHQAHLIGRDPRKELLGLSAFLVEQRDRIEAMARRMVKRFIDRLIIIYADSSLFYSVANRWRTQLNENAKVFAHHNVIPEMNHNEIVGLGSPRQFNDDTLIVFLGDPTAHPRNKIRHRLLKSLIRNEISNILEVQPLGENSLQHGFWTIMLGDFISYYLALDRGVDPMPVQRIENLKKRLARIK
jgi:glucose/mannose-6-phosphate isomerase